MILTKRFLESDIELVVKICRPRFEPGWYALAMCGFGAQVGENLSYTNFNNYEFECYIFHFFPIF